MKNCSCKKILKCVNENEFINISMCNIKDDNNFEENLINQLEEKERIILQIKEDCALKLKCMEEKYTSHIQNLENELQNYQEKLTYKDKNKIKLQGQINHIDEINQEMKQEINNLKSKLKEADNLQKNVEFNWKNQLEKLNQDLKDYLMRIENLNKNKEELEKNYLRVNENKEKVLFERNEIRNKYEEKQKEFSKIKIENELFKEENEILKKEHLMLKNDFINFRDQYNESACKKINQIGYENRKLKKFIQKHYQKDKIISVYPCHSSRKFEAEPSELAGNSTIINRILKNFRSK